MGKYAYVGYAKDNLVFLTVSKIKNKTPAKRKERKAATIQIYVGRLQRCLAYIEANLDQSISFEKLAEIACFSPFHFHRIFRGLTGETVADLILRIRMEYAYHLLQNQQETLTTTSFEIGYENVEHLAALLRSFFTKMPQRLKNYLHNFGQIILMPLSCS